MNKQEALKLKPGDKFRRKPSLWNSEGFFPEIYIVDHVEFVVNATPYDHKKDKVIIIDTKGKKFEHIDICLP